MTYFRKTLDKSTCERKEELERVVTGIPKYLVLKKSYKIDGKLPSNINQNHFQNPIISPS